MSDYGTNKVFEQDYVSKTAICNKIRKPTADLSAVALAKAEAVNLFHSRVLGFSSSRVLEFSSS
jgi:hypothetical protein